MLTTLCALALAVPALASSPGAWFQVPNAPAAGFETVSSQFYIAPNATRVTGYYAAAQWSFSGHDVHYFGIQPRSAGSAKTGHLAYSVFGPGSTIGDPARCSGGADGGSGVSCSMEIDIDFGRWYTIESKVVEHKPDGSKRWNGTITDDAGRATYIASFYTDASYGGLNGKVSQWLEWYKYNGDGKTAAQRDCQQWFQIHYGLPKGNGGGTATKIANNKATIDDKCALKAGRPNSDLTFGADGSLTITAGVLPQP